MSSTSSSSASSSDLVIVLDMDETLICSDWHPEFTTLDSKNGLESFPSINEGRQFDVYKRPHLDEFLKQLSLRYQVYVFTAALPVYADPILNALDPLHTIFKKRFYRYDMTSHQTKNVAALDYFNQQQQQQHGEEGTNQKNKIDPKRFVMIDDQERYMIDHITNGIKIKKFNLKGGYYYGAQKTKHPKDDDSLLMILKLLQMLEHVDDVRPILKVVGMLFSIL